MQPASFTIHALHLQDLQREFHRVGHTHHVRLTGVSSYYPTHGYRLRGNLVVEVRLILGCRSVFMRYCEYRIYNEVCHDVSQVRVLFKHHPVSFQISTLLVVKACKVPMFSFGRLKNSDPRLGVEMSSTGEARLMLKGGVQGAFSSLTTCAMFSSNFFIHFL